MSAIRRFERSHPDFPAALTMLADPPGAIYVAGDVTALHLPQIAIVGARNATPGGLANARAFAARLARAGFVVTSGLAYGIDAAAHEGALEGGGRTIAVCAIGLDRIYPRAHEALAERIVAHGGALVSEHGAGMAPLRSLFPQRNRLIAALALGTLVVEAALKSGSLITARAAAELGREVLAIPGSIHNVHARGCHLLIRDGATLVESVEDVVLAVAPALSRLRALAVSQSEPPAPESRRAGASRSCVEARASPSREPATERLLQALGHDPVAFDDIVTRAGLTTPVVSSMLTALELEGVVAALPGGRHQRVRFD